MRLGEASCSGGPGEKMRCKNCNYRMEIFDKYGVGHSVYHCTLSGTLTLGSSSLRDWRGLPIACPEVEEEKPIPVITPPPFYGELCETVRKLERMSGYRDERRERWERTCEMCKYYDCSSFQER